MDAATKHDVVSHEQWTEARKVLLAKEKAFTRQRDDLTRQRRELPWERVTKPYLFDASQRKETLGGLFGEHRQLLIYHFMLGPGWQEGCKSCSFLADHFDGGTVHLAHRDVAFAVVSRAPIAEIEAFKKRMGWRFQWVSSHGSDFNFDYQASFHRDQSTDGKVYYNYQTREFGSDEAPGLSAFYKGDNGEVFHTYSTYGRGLDIFLGAYNFLDHAPKGRDEDNLGFTMSWVRHHDRYDDDYAVDIKTQYVQPLIKMETSA